MISLKFVDADRGLKKAITALACIAAGLSAAESSRAGEYRNGAQFHSNHRYAIQSNQYSKARPSPDAPNFGFFPTLWRKWPGLWAVAGGVEPSREQPELVEPQPTELPSEALPVPGEVPGPIILPSPGDVDIEGGPPRPPTEPKRETDAEPLLPPTDVPDDQPPSEQPETEPAPPAQTPSEPQLPPELRETLPPRDQPESEPLPIPDELEKMPPDEPEGLLGRTRQPRLLPASSSGWTARRARPRHGAAVSGIDRPTPASFDLPTVSTPGRRAPSATTHTLGQQISPDSRKESRHRFASRGGRPSDSASGSLSRDDRPSADRIRTRPTGRSVGNPLRREGPTSNDQGTAPTELILHNPLRDKPREELRRRRGE